MNMFQGGFARRLEGPPSHPDPGPHTFGWSALHHLMKP
eukprot:CAMPEP_0115075138 /NCGR_PEP_ID=MMETSP0227-20121206/15708_1 /TAXON_ID=89957 /ORGANISM="Polarella glacialis, Strain CCMP 1383" /LENGTH=37 /DNA_ID= /DNA_START= /DNA_END= /DNA_ORIENTATION=